MAHFFAVLLALLQSPAPPPSPSLALDARWVVRFDSPPATAPGYDATTAYIPLKDGTLVAVNLDRGTIRWSLDVPTAFTPATGGGMVFTVGDSSIEARDARSGAMAWTAPLPGEAALPLYFDTGWLLASTTDGDLAALRASDGTLMWRQQLGAPLSGPPGPALDRLYLALADNRLLSVLLTDGETLWARTLAHTVTTMLALDDQLVVGTAGKQVMSVDLRNGRERWSWDVGGDVSGAPAADDRHIYFAARDNVVRAVDRGSGNLRWKAVLPSRPAGGPLLLPDAVLMPMVSSEIAGFDRETGKAAVTVKAAGEIGAQPFFRPLASLASPRLITVSREGHLQGFGRRFEPVPQPLQIPLIGAPALP